MTRHLISTGHRLIGCGIRRTAPNPATRRAKVTKWIGLAVSIAWAALLGWLLLRSK